MSDRSPRRVVLTMSRATRLYGWLLVAAGALLIAPVWSLNAWFALLPASVALVGLMLATLQRRLVFDQEAGTFRQEQQVLGVTSSLEVPLFHLRAVVVVAQPRGNARNRYVAFVDRRVGEPIYLDEARRVARLMKIAEAVAEVAELRLEYEAAGAGNN